MTLLLIVVAAVILAGVLFAVVRDPDPDEPAVLEGRGGVRGQSEDTLH
jgi:hypothetical protein